MQPLATSRKILYLFCVYPADEVDWKKIACGIFTISNFLTNIIGLLASAAFFVKFVTVNLEVSLYGLFTVFGFAISIYAIIIIYFARHKIYNIFVTLSQIYDESKNQLIDMFNDFS